MSDTTTPKRNEAVARYHWRENPITGNAYLAQDDAGAFVLHTDYEALQGEVSRLREALQNMLGAFDTPIRRRKYPNSFGDEAITSSRIALNLEPPTDGR